MSCRPHLLLGVEGYPGGRPLQVQLQGDAGGAEDRPRVQTEMLCPWRPPGTASAGGDGWGQVDHAEDHALHQEEILQ